MDGKVSFDYLNEIDAVQKCIEKGYNHSILVNQTWDECKKHIIDKDIVIYGVGNGICSFVRDYGSEITIDYVVDSKKDGRRFSDFCYICPEKYIDEKEPWLVSLESMTVESPHVLDKMDPSKTVVIIVSLLKYMEIYKILTDKGFMHSYSYLCMEANKRNKAQKYLDPKMEFLNNCQMLPIRSNTVAVQTIGGYCGHSRQVCEQLKKNNPNYNFVWVIPNKEYKYHFPVGTGTVRQGTPDYYRLMAMAKLWLFEEPLVPEFPKKKGQFCVQLKHWASVTLKKFGHNLNVGLSNYNEDFEMFLWKYNDEITDCYIVGSDFDEKTIREGFLYTHECFHAGSPRSDLLFSDIDYKEIICRKYNLNYDDNFCLYAPTFRYDGNIEYSFKDTLLDFYKLKDILESKFKGRWNILLRLHPRVQEMHKNVNTLPDFVTDVSTYMDSEELVAASDIMITDYSSIMFEPAFIKKPVFLYAPDLDKYLKEERTFLIDYNTLPFSIAHDNDELVDNISNFSQVEYVKCLDAFLEKYGVHEDGHAAERAAKHISDLINRR